MRALASPASLKGVLSARAAAAALATGVREAGGEGVEFPIADGGEGTAEVLGAAMSDKTIVFTGAMIPYEIANSDALFNFGFACAAAQMLPPGVYVAMNGKVFTWDNVTKNRAAGVFQAL